MNERENTQALQSAQKAHEHILPFARSPAPKKSFASIATFMLVWYARPFVQFMPHKVLVKIMGPWFGNFVAAGGECGIHVLLVIAEFDKNGDGEIDADESTPQPHSNRAPGFCAIRRSKGLSLS